MSILSSTSVFVEKASILIHFDFFLVCIEYIVIEIHKPSKMLIVFLGMKSLVGKFNRSADRRTICTCVELNDFSKAQALRSSDFKPVVRIIN